MTSARWRYPTAILRKPGPLTAEEQTVMRKHCEIGHEMLSRIPFLSDVAEIVLGAPGVL